MEGRDPINVIFHFLFPSHGVGTSKVKRNPHLPPMGCRKYGSQESGSWGKMRGNVLCPENSDLFLFIGRGRMGLVVLRSPGVI